MGDTKISVNVTPDGRGDALLSTRGWTVSGTGEETPDEVFVVPEERTMTMREFVDMLETPVGDDHGDVTHRTDLPCRTYRDSAAVCSRSSQNWWVTAHTRCVSRLTPWGSRRML